MKEILNSITIYNNIGYTDGIGAVWALRNHGFKKATKIPGCELWLEIIKKFYKEKTFYLIGSKSEVIGKTVKKLKQEYSGIKILNYRNGYIKSEEEKFHLINDIQTKKPDIVFVAAGSPYQELLMNEMLSHHQALYMGLGGSFDVFTGFVKRAPDFWLRYHLEWLYRLLYQPSRFKRQIHLVRFVYLNLLGRI